MQAIGTLTREFASRRGLPVPPDLVVTTAGPTTYDAPLCPLCKDARWLKRYKNGRDVFGGTELLACDCMSVELKHRAWLRAREASGLHRTLHEMTLTNFVRTRQPEAHAAAGEFVANPERHWLLLVGDVGTGKTHLCAAIVTALLITPRRPLYAVVPDLLRNLRAGFDLGDHEQRWRDVRDADVLIIDDYGAEQSTPWSDETIFALVDYRFAVGLPTVVATNLHPQAMPPRIGSRLQDAARSRVVTMRPGDYRQSQERLAERNRELPGCERDAS